jgi:hypothetical protein
MSVGFLIEVERSARLRREGADRAALAGAGFAVRFKLLVLRAQADRLLRRTLGPARPMRKTRIDELSPHILRDIGWPPE